MGSPMSTFVAMLSGRASRRQETAERRRIERELAGFVSESDKAELSAILERNADEQGMQIHDLITRQVLATNEYRAA